MFDTMKVLKSSVVPQFSRYESVYNLRRPTAIGKESILDTDRHLLEADSWKHKSFPSWQPIDIANWISSIATDAGFSIYDVDMTRFQVNGAELAAMSEFDFKQRDPSLGSILFHRFQSVMMTDQLQNTEPRKRRGRPVTKSQGSPRPKKRFRLWEFLLGLLSQPEHCPSVLEWEKREDGSFRIMQSAKLAELWGRFRGRKNMDYVKLSRLMRYYYKQGVLIADKQRLVYRFGPNAVGWEEISQNSAWPGDLSAI